LGMLDFTRFTHLTFDCYGTLIDWENGILDAVGPVLQRHGVNASPVEVLRLYTKMEAEQEARPYQRYRDVLRQVMIGFGAALGFQPSAAELEVLPDSIGRWQPFPDTVPALRRLGERFKLVIVSNIDDAMFGNTAKLLGVKFDDVITAEQVRSYKPALVNFEFTLKRLGVPASQILHVAQSLYHDHMPARRLGFGTVWINRPSRLPGTGLALPADVRPHLELPDLQSLVRRIDEGRP